jgi:hypothetical protein
MASRYWVGNGGNWSDYTNHWSATSNGSPGASKPTSADTVYFNANAVKAAGHTITVDEETNCLDMVWTGIVNTPTFEMGSYILNIYGTATFVAGVTISPTSSTIHMHGANKTFTGAGKTFHDIVFLGNTTVSGNNTFVDITFTSGTTITFTQSSNQTVTTLSGDGVNATSTGYVKVKSSTTTPFTFTCASGTITRTYWALQYCTATGGATFNLTKASVADTVGNNTGWNITYLAANRYWRGGTGTWYNTNTNWYEVDETTQAPYPTVLDDVYFDAGSFTGASQTVTAGGTINCKNLIWTDATNTPTFDLNTRTLNITGSATFIAAMNITCGTSDIIVSGNSTTFNGAGKTFYNVKLTGTPITIVGNNSYTDLGLTAAKTATFTAGSTQTCGRFGAIGTSGNVITINTTSSGSAFTLSKTSNTVTFDYCSIKDCTASGGATFTAYNSTNVSGNSGITFSAGNPVYGRFFVAASASNTFTDTNCWSTVSGGSTGASAPTSSDNVYFDGNSYNGAHYHVTCGTTSTASLDCTNSGEVYFTHSTQSYVWNVYGNIINSDAVDWTSQYAPSLVMKSTSGGNTITTGGGLFSSTFTIDCVGGDYTLTDAFNNEANLYIKNGTFNTGDFDVNCSIFNSNYATTRVINMGDSTLTAVYINFTDPTNLTFNKGTSTIICTGAQFYGGGRTFNNVEFTGNSTITGNNTFNDLKFTIGAATLTTTITESSTQTFDTLSGDGLSGTKLIAIQSSVAGTHYHFVCASGTINREYWSIKDCYASGGATFNATKSYDISGNSGWNITAIPPNRYWVGDAGSWTASDSTHWSESSGGVGDAPVPIASDNVIFDANSFSTTGFTCSITETVECNDLDFSAVTNNPTIELRNKTYLNISGNATFDSGITLDINHELYTMTLTSNNCIFNGAGLTFPYVQFTGTSVTIIGNNTFGELRLGLQAKTVNFTAGSNQSVTRLGVLGAADNVITLQSTISGTQYYIVSLTKVTFDYCSIKDFNGAGATFTAYNSTNVSGNSDITFSAGSPVYGGRYYVGQLSSNYVQTSGFWANVSGGVGYSSVPTSSDNVFFDENSLLIDSTIYCMTWGDFSCLNMDWTGCAYSPRFSMSTDDCYCYGNFIGNPNLSISNSSCTFYFASTSIGNEITSNGATFEVLRFDGIGGEWTLLDTLTCINGAVGTLSCTNGTLATNGQSINVYGNITTLAGMTLNLGSSIITSLTAGISIHADTTINAGTSTLIMNAGLTTVFAGSGHTFHDVEIKSTTCTISGNNTFRDLRLTAGKTCKITAGSTQIISSLSGVGNAVNLVTLKSSTDTSTYTLSSAYPEIEANWYSIRDCVATGGATFYGYNCTDVSGNSGWTWGAKRYWVGNSGNWTDNYWSATSGGAAGASAPTALTHVYFDANSFNGAGQTIALVGDIVCRSLNFTGATNTPTLMMVGATDLRIYGSLTLIAAMVVDNSNWNGYWNFESIIRGRTITTAGHTLTNFLFNGDAGSFILNDNLTLSGELYSYSEDLDTNDANVSCTDWTFHYYSDPRVIRLGSSTITISGNWELEVDSGLVLFPETSTIVMTGNNKNFIGTGRTYNKIELQGTPIVLSGDNTISELKLTADKTVQFTAGSTQIIGAITGSGSSGHLVTMESTSDGSAWNLTKTSGSVNVSYYSIQDSHAAGGADFLAMGSVDVSSNEGWEFLSTILGNATAAFKIPGIYAGSSGGGGGGSGGDDGVNVSIYPARCYASSLFIPPAIYADDGTRNINALVCLASCLFISPTIEVFDSNNPNIHALIATATCLACTPTLHIDVDINGIDANADCDFLSPQRLEHVNIVTILGNSNTEFLLPILSDGHNLDIPCPTGNATTEFLIPDLEIYFHYESVDFLLDVKGQGNCIFIQPLVLV